MGMELYQPAGHGKAAPNLIEVVVDGDVNRAVLSKTQHACVAAFGGLSHLGR